LGEASVQWPIATIFFFKSHSDSSLKVRQWPAALISPESRVMAFFIAALAPSVIDECQQ
jgi:hypothetical protein